MAPRKPEVITGDMAALTGQMFDIVIVGGGITGTALAYAATHARDPLRVALLERGTLANGTSSRSSGLLHGGLRYLAQGRVPLVRRLIRGRRSFARLAPHLVRRAPFMLPIRGRGPHAPWLLRLAMAAYGLCDSGRDPQGASERETPRWLNSQSARVWEPQLADLATTGAFRYHEFTVDAVGLVEALAGAAQAAGATVATGVHCQRLHIAANRVRGVWVTSEEGGPARRIDARVVVDATGPWSGQLEQRLESAQAIRRSPMRLSRGSHLVLPRERLPLASSVVLFAPDGRALFASPRDEGILVGTTERPHSTSPEDVHPSAEEIGYLLAAASTAFPAARLRPSDIMRAYAGVRPLATVGSSAQSDLGTMDRGYVLDWPAPGLLAVRGGKLTLAMSAARQALAAIDRRALSLGMGRARPRRDDDLPPLPSGIPALVPVPARARTQTPPRRAA